MIRPEIISNTERRASGGAVRGVDRVRFAAPLPPGGND
jgi:hypothetical protein